MKPFKLSTAQKAGLQEFSARWQIAGPELFGSALQDDFTEESEVDLLLSFAPGARWSLFDQAKMQEELEALFGRKVDVLTRRAVERSLNPIRRKEILSSARPLLPAAAL